MKVTVVDYGIGNLLSVRRALVHCGAEVAIAKTPEDIKNAERLIVPGVGAFKKCMEAIDSLNLRKALIEFANSGKPYLGICVGMQMLFEKSFEFGEHEGLGIIKGHVEKMDVPDQPVPFIGWKEVTVNDKSNQFYFVHSYHAISKNDSDVIARYKFDTQEIVAAVQKDNVTGVQFHPEKSAHDGIEFLKKFLAK